MAMTDSKGRVHGTDSKGHCWCGYQRKVFGQQSTQSTMLPKAAKPKGVFQR